jgi:hypothetical protein
VFFLVQYLVLTLQAYWVCEITAPGWKDVPGSICVLSEAVPVTQMISKSSRFLVPLPVFIESTPSDDYLGRYLGFYPLARMANPLSLSVRCILHPRIQIIKGVRVPALRSRLLRIFSVSIATTMASVTHAVLVMDRPGILEAIFGTVVLLLSNTQSFELPFTLCVFPSGGVEASVSVIVSSMSVIIPAILRALDAGDPFMQEDTVDPGFGTSVEIARMTLTRVELGLPTSHAITVVGNNNCEGVVRAMSPEELQRSIDLDEKRDKKHRLTTQTSDGSLGTSMTTKVVCQSDECDITDSRASQVRSLVLKKDAEVYDKGQKGKRKTT